MEKAMRNAPSFAVLVVMILQITRVSAFGIRVNAGILAPVFAVFLAGTIYVLSYWQARTKYEVTADRETEKQKWAAQVRQKQLNDRVHKTSGGWLAVFVLIEGFLNLAETMAHLPAGVKGWVMVGALAYGAFPTLAAFGLGNLQAMIDKIPHGVSAKRSAIEGIFEAFAKRIETQSGASATQAQADAPQSAEDTAQQLQDAPHNSKNAPYPRACPHGCGAQLRTPQEYSAHVGRWCEVVKAKNAQNAESEVIPIEIPKTAHIEQTTPPTG